MGTFERLMGGDHGRRLGGGHHERYDINTSKNQTDSGGRESRHTSTPTMTCIVCGTGNNSVALFCQQCGTCLIPVKCEGCNAEMMGGMKFCGQCGMERK